MEKSVNYVLFFMFFIKNPAFLRAGSILKTVFKVLLNICVLDSNKRQIVASLGNDILNIFFGSDLVLRIGKPCRGRGHIADLQRIALADSAYLFYPRRIGEILRI